MFLKLISITGILILGLSFLFQEKSHSKDERLIEKTNSLPFDCAQNPNEILPNYSSSLTLNQNEALRRIEAMNREQARERGSRVVDEKVRVVSQAQGEAVLERAGVEVQTMTPELPVECNIGDNFLNNIFQSEEELKFINGPLRN